MLPRESGEYIVANAKYVKVHPEGIKKLAAAVVESIADGRLSVANFSQHELHPKPSDKIAVEWIFLVDTLNFCFWTPGDAVKYKVNGYTGYFALCAAVNRAIAEGIDITNAEYYANVGIAKLQHIFRSDDGVTKVPLLEKRLECLHEVGKRLLEKWSGKFENVIKAAEHSAVKLLEFVVSEFPCYRDDADFAGKRVTIYKRAQILIGDLWACYSGSSFGTFDDIGEITMFADYRVPQVLVHFGSLEYTNDLMEVLGKDTIMQNGDPMEVEIRGASIYIVEELKEIVINELKSRFPDISRNNVNSVLLDHFLWDYRRQHAKELEYIPFHKVFSVYY